MGCLYIVATPIGNLEDITQRALRILREVDLIAAEDTRHSRKLLSSFDIHTPLLSYFKDKEAGRAEKILEKLRHGLDVALISDAGTPCISDPGSVLVQRARRLGVAVIPVPGASALTAAVSVAGFPPGPFVFLGFLPSTSSKRKKFLSSQVRETKPSVFYESPKRIVSALKDCLHVFGDRRVFVARELTKIHEELLNGTLQEIVDVFSGRKKIKGEFVVMVEGATLQNNTPETHDLHELLSWYRENSSLSMRDAVRRIAEDIGASRSAVYQEALKVWGA